MSNGDEYEMSDPFTIGGSTGRYYVSSPWNTECEWALASAIGVGTFGFSLANAPTEVNVPASAGPTTLFTGQGMLISASVSAIGAADLEFQDAAGNIIAEVPSTATLDQVFQFNEAFNTSLVVNNSASTPVVTATFAPSQTTQPTTAMFSLCSKNPNIGIPTSANALGASYGMVAEGTDNNNAAQCFLGILSTATPFVAYNSDLFMPLSSPAYVYMRTATPALTQVYVTVIFRRKLDRIIPDKPRQKPHTHTHVQGRRQHRGMMAGFAAQYPEEGAPYQHQELPQQDTGVGRRGVFPLGPTTITHRGVSKRGR